MADLPDPDWYFENVLADAAPGRYDPLPRGPLAGWRDVWRQRSQVADEVLATAAQRGFVLSTAELASLGVTRGRARHATARGNWTCAGRGYVAPFALAGSTPEMQRQRYAVMTAAAVRSRPHSVATGRSAATLLGLPTYAVPTVPELIVSQQVGIAARGRSHLYRVRLAESEISAWYGIEHTAAARTVVDLARRDRRDAIMAVDAALRDGLVNETALAEALDAALGRPGIRRARQVLAHASPLSESPLESLTRLVLLDDGFPIPELQVKIGGYRVDMLFREQRLILEIDGLGKYTAAELRREKRREHELRALGYRVERVGWDDIALRWAVTRVWLRAALQRST
jgi:very-short-patch-repair endonuclease